MKVTYQVTAVRLHGYKPGGRVAVWELVENGIEIVDERRMRVPVNSEWSQVLGVVLDLESGSISVPLRNRPTVNSGDSLTVEFQQERLSP